ncbi:MAG: aminoacyl-histidine dipeptidase [Bacteroidaceae bacterium]|nr:aminoacyl-histidine dipeptidase [Bacteroidaceae bacterium]
MANSTQLQPSSVFEMFALINQVPRPSKHEEQMIAFLVDFAKKNNLPYKVDEVGNVLISKPATAGMEDRPTVILQSHMDMVCEKNNDVNMDFMTDPIQTWIDGEWMKAKGTTLGADDGIGCAMEMALLLDDTVKHGPIQCVFTRDEETGLTGAEGMQPGFMEGDMLINLDSEDEGQIFVSCAGGCRTEAVFTFTPEPASEAMFFLRLQVKGLMGGHSGDDIDKKRANANKILARFLYMGMKKYGLRISDIQAGGLHNAIPREAEALVAIPVRFKEQVRADWNIFAADVEEEFRVTEPSMQFLLESADAAATVLPEDVNCRLISALQAVHNGVLAMSQDMELVETSSNLASIRQEEPGRIRVNSSQRSSFMSNRHNMSNTIAATFELAGAEVNVGEGYPGWKPNPDSRLLKVAVEQYERLFGHKPIVRGIHAGLECGLFSEKYPNLDMVSFGPTLRGVHSPDERLEIKTVDLVWKHLLAILENI